MTNPSTPRAMPPHLLTWVLVALSLLVVWTIWLIGRDFLSSLVWAVSLAVVAAPAHRWITRRTGDHSTLAAGLMVGLIAVVLVAPVAFVVQSTAGQLAGVATVAQKQIKDNQWRETINKSPQLQKAVGWLESIEGDISAPLQSVAGSVGKFAGAAFASGLKTLTTLLITLFFLFFFFRDRDDFLRYIRRLLPLTDAETDTLFQRIGDTIYATIFGTLVVRGLQGALGGLAFWFLGVPGALLWGVVMAIVSLIPILGAFIIWVPAAIYLAAIGSVGKAIILVVWGVGVIGTVDNVLYPTLVGDRLKMHTVAVFVATLGGLGVFGAPGFVLAPVVLATGDTLLKFWRQRLAAERAG